MNHVNGDVSVLSPAIAALAWEPSQKRSDSHPVLSRHPSPRRLPTPGSAARQEDVSTSCWVCWGGRSGDRRLLHFCLSLFFVVLGLFFVCLFFFNVCLSCSCRVGFCFPFTLESQSRPRSRSSLEKAALASADGRPRRAGAAAAAAAGARPRN